MGKRELFLILGFVVAGIVVFQIAAPPAKDGEGFSFSRMWNRARAEISSHAVAADTTSRRTIAVPDGVTEIQLVDFPQAFTLVGEDRRDIEYDLKATSRGPDQNKALEYAKEAEVRSDQFGASLSLQLHVRQDSNPRAELKVRVPSRLKVRAQSARRSTIGNISALHLEASSGETKISNVADGVTGNHRGGNLSVSSVGSVKMTIAGSSATFSMVKNGVTLDIRGSGSAVIGDTEGALEIDATNGDVRISNHQGRIRVGGMGGKLQIDSPTAETRVDMRDAEVEVRVASAVPITAQTTGETLRILITGTPPVAIDAVATDGGKIQAGDFGQQPEVVEGRQRLRLQLGDRATSQIALRNRHSDIVIRQAK